MGSLESVLCPTSDTVQHTVCQDQECFFVEIQILSNYEALHAENDRILHSISSSFISMLIKLVNQRLFQHRTRERIRDGCRDAHCCRNSIALVFAGEKRKQDANKCKPSKGCFCLIRDGHVPMSTQWRNMFFHIYFGSLYTKTT